MKNGRIIASGLRIYYTRFYVSTDRASKGSVGAEKNPGHSGWGRIRVAFGYGTTKVGLRRKQMSKRFLAIKTAFGSGMT